MSRLFAVAIVGLLVCGSAFGADYRNPVIRGMNPDPSVVRVGRDYFAATSSFEYFPSCPVYHSTDLVHWQRIGYALDRQEQFTALHDEHPSTYACTLRYHDGMFYALTTDARADVNFMVTTRDPRGPWSLPLQIDHGMFDPSLFFDDDGKVYYTRRGPDADHPIVQAEIDVKTGKLLTPMRVVSNGNFTHDAEGPHLYKIDGWYYLSLAEGGSRFLHMQTIGRSHSPWGPFEPDPANPWASQRVDWDYTVRAVGHCDLVDTTDGAWWTLCLGTRHVDTMHFSLGRETFLFPVTWKDGWPSVDSSLMRTLRVNAKTLPPHPWPPESIRDEFSEVNLGNVWNTFGPAGAKMFSLSERPGFLRLHGTAEALTFQHASAFVGRRQTEWWTRSTARMEFTPHREGDAAGLTVFMSPRFHYDIEETICGTKPCVRLMKQIADSRFVAAEAAVPEAGLRLRIESTPQRYRFLYTGDTEEWKVLGEGDAQVIASEVASVWSGMYVGMFCQSAEGDGAVADFDWFEEQARKDETWNEAVKNHFTF